LNPAKYYNGLGVTFVSHSIGNTSVGSKALYSNTTESQNTANGSQALLSNTTGHRNTATGNLALNSNTTGNNRTASGYSANSIGAAYTNSTGLGYDADPTATNRVRIGNTAVTEIGGQVGWSTLSDKRFNPHYS